MYVSQQIKASYNKILAKTGGFMLVQTHYHMARQVHRYIREKYGLDLCLDLLEYGSIKPDFMVLRFPAPSHYYETGCDAWLREIRQLQQNERYGGIKAFSHKLGVVLHFAADFFCGAHNYPEIRKSLWAHINYERRLDQELSRYIDFPGTCQLRSNDINIVLEKLRQEYLASGPGLDKDVYYIYTVLFSLAEQLVEYILFRAVRAA